MSLGRWLVLVQWTLWSSAACKTEGPASSQQRRLHPLEATGFWYFLSCCKSQWRLGLVTVGTVDLVAEQRLKPTVYKELAKEAGQSARVNRLVCSSSI